MTTGLSVIKQLELVFLPEARDRRFGYNQWLVDRVIQVYVRHGRHALSPIGPRFTLEIASISVKPKQQQRGLFKSFLEQAHALNPWEGTYVENVHNPHLAAWFKRQSDWTRANDNPFDISFYKLK